MGTIAWTGTLYRTRDVPSLTDINKCQHIILIAMFAVLVIKIRTKKVTSVVFIKNIKTNYIPAIGIFAFQMSIDVIIRKRRKLTTTCICRCKDTTFYLNTSINSKQNTLFQCEYFCFLTLFQVDNGIKMTFFQDLKSTFRWFIVFSFGGKVTLTGFLADCSLLGAKETVRVSNLMYPKWDCSWFTLTTCSQKIHWPARAVSAEEHSPG